ncbi:ATPase synthesis protein 25, mitochondrial [Debaryomyces fabryi]|uniref:ATPase synthesis protein 25 n=1 Tax=Debaryomyces fabryi TaxID=58627 RepID=A0A0V1PRZ3_9ASCO|nr:ATPase synthesis protein 25, mitochondrial [Debaryomyces fabryi]KRZ99008.1 ATPase synthesis protein 25, mitochondrial [Debaryomyces fabryi]CUM49319.1 unnamed protein product [Debaryomyces fabryi]
MANLLGYVGRRGVPNVIRRFSGGRFIGATHFRCYSAGQNSKLNLTESTGEDPSEIQKVSEGSLNEVKRDFSTTENEAEESVPWYLRDDSSSPLLETKKVELPVVPDHAPTTVQTFLELLSDEYGLEDIELFDLTQLGPENEYHADNQPSDYMIICTGKSEKHIYKASNELRTYIKHNFELIPKIEGMASNSKTPAARRRMLRRARKGPLATDNDYGRTPNSWVMCDTAVNNICIHILTESRRDELNLESLWCREEDIEKYSRSESAAEESDDIFIGIRRFHTMTPFARHYQQTRLYSSSSSNEALEASLHKLSVGNLTTEDLKQQIKSFEADFHDPSIKDYNTRFNFYRSIHIQNPDVVSFDELTFILLDKYSSLKIILNNDIDVSKERIQDTVDFMKLLIDSPEIRRQFDLSNSKGVNAYADELYDTLSQFLSTLFRFSKEQIDISRHPEFLPLLWRLSFVQKKDTVIGSRMIDDIIYQEGDIPNLPGQPSIFQAKNRARDILDLINYYNQKIDENALPTNSFKELLLFTYGNAGDWAKFWNTWEVSFNLLNNSKIDSKSSIKNWVRLIVYLAIRNDRSAIVYFLNNYWNCSTSIAGSFIDDFELNNNAFSSDEEKRSFKSSVNKMLNSINNENEGNPSFSNVKEFVDSLE